MHKRKKKINRRNTDIELHAESGVSIVINDHESYVEVKNMTKHINNQAQNKIITISDR